MPNHLCFFRSKENYGNVIASMPNPLCFFRSKENCQVLQQNMASQKEGEKDLETELERSRQKESELLQFTEKMTGKNAALHSENLTLSSKVIPYRLCSHHKSLKTLVDIVVR